MSTAKQLPRSRFKSLDDVRHEREMLEYEVDAFLRSKGWTHSSSTPGCFWLWCKTITWTETQRDHVKGGFKRITHTIDVLTDKDTALSIQDALDEADS